MGLVAVGAAGAYRLTRRPSSAVGAPDDGPLLDPGSTPTPATIDVPEGGGTLQDPASALEPARRVRLDRRIGFPVELSAEIILTDSFGDARGSRRHQGVDIWRRDGAPGHPLVACVDGVLVEQVRDGDPESYNQGNSWVLQAADGYAFRYHHLDEFATGLDVDSVVKLGDVIGTMGSTGNTNAPHLHFEVRPTGPIGTPVDPHRLPVAGTDRGRRFLIRHRPRGVHQYCGRVTISSASPRESCQEFICTDR